MKKLNLSLLFIGTSILLLAQNFANTSVLNTGNWHKIAVESDGVYKIDFAFMQDNGLNPQSIQFSNFGVFGQGMGMLPEENADTRVDDLAEIAIKIKDNNNNNNWDADDYVIFYAKGPHNWTYNTATQEWAHVQNIYTDAAAYFISTNSGSGKGIPTDAAVTGTGSTITTFDDWQFFEEEKNNVIHTELNGVSGMGRKWFGEIFNNIASTQSISFSFPNLVTNEAVQIRSKFIAASSTSSTLFTIKNNGTQLYTQNIGSLSETDNYPNIVKETDELIRTFNSSSGDINLELQYSNNSSQAKGWLDYIEIVAKRQLSMNGDWIAFRSFSSLNNPTSTFQVTNINGGTEIWDVSTPADITKMPTSSIGSSLTFGAITTSLKEFVAVNTNGNNFSTPSYIGNTHNQNLHGLSQVDMIIIANDDIKPAAEDLANFHYEEDGLTTSIVMIDEIYNEFSSGQQDLSAIRDFLRMFYERGTPIKYVLLFGDASFDYKDRIPSNNNIIPTYESVASYSVAGSYCTDDFIGFLEQDEGGNIISNGDDLDIAIGRIPVDNVADAQGVVDKIKYYKSREGHGAWINELTFVADDEDSNLHFTQVEKLVSQTDVANQPDYNIDKIYFDAYDQVNAGGGDRYPDVLNTILRKVQTGTFLLNYTGHGGPKNWAQERVFNIDDMQQLDNKDNLPLFITATCDFAPYDGADFRSAGEVLITNPNGGAIAMITTTRLVYANANYDMNKAILDRLFQPINGKMPTIGEAMMLGKNAVSGSENNRKFALLGDPALTLNYPTYDVVTTAINDIPISQTDTLEALSRVKIEGELQNASGTLLSDFNGVLYSTVYDKSTTYATKGQDVESQEADFSLQNNILFKGKSSVVNGIFSFEFIVPKDINYSFNNGKISYYAIENSTDRDANGYETNFIVGGTADSVGIDNAGPLVDVYMNDSTFAFGGLTDENPSLFVKLSDESGINTVGTGVGHDIAGVLDENTQSTYLLNDYYEATLDDFTSGTVSYPFNKLENGLHQIKVKAWDVHNNPGEGYTEFIVAESANVAIQNVLNYPNPFTTHTSFIFEHNHPGDILDVQVQIYTVSGKIVKTIQTSVQSNGNSVVPNEITWDGLDDYGDAIGRGVYVYKVTAQGSEGSAAHEFEKLVILR
ncbi:MAG: type IX secretion system sortase PorU [Chitinophagales bacterium]